jgi:hypothetical protein
MAKRFCHYLFFIRSKNEVLSADFSSLHVVHMALNMTEKNGGTFGNSHPNEDMLVPP